MYYTFIDLEASNAFSRSSVCCIGLVRTDEQLNIIAQELILINPRDAFNLEWRVDIGFTRADFKDKPTFDKVYGYLLDNYFTKGTTVIGHAVMNDIRMLQAVCRKYGLPCFEFECLCTQMLYNYHSGSGKVMSLAAIAEELNEEFRAHRADEDARMSYLTLKHICNSTGKTLNKLVEEYNIKPGKLKNDEIKEIFCSRNAVGALKDSKRGKKLLLNEFKRKVRRQRELAFEGAFSGMRVCFDEHLEAADIDFTRDAIRHIVNGGSKYTSSACECDIFVCDEGGESSRLHAAFTLARRGVRIISSEEFFAMLGDLPRQDYPDDCETLRLIAVRKAKRDYYGS